MLRGLTASSPLRLRRFLEGSTWFICCKTKQTKAYLSNIRAFILFAVHEFNNQTTYNSSCIHLFRQCQLTWIFYSWLNKRLIFAPWIHHNLLILFLFLKGLCTLTLINLHTNVNASWMGSYHQQSLHLMSHSVTPVVLGYHYSVHINSQGWIGLLLILFMFSSIIHWYYIFTVYEGLFSLVVCVIAVKSCLVSDHMTNKQNSSSIFL